MLTIEAALEVILYGTLLGLGAAAIWLAVQWIRIARWKASLRHINQPPNITNSYNPLFEDWMFGIGPFSDPWNERSLDEPSVGGVPVSHMAAQQSGAMFGPFYQDPYDSDGKPCG